jgi:HAD superfamily hydrolase (TIGR01484 family)
MQLVATDLDGTIVAADGTVSARTVAALRACERAGIPVVIVTGRPPRWLPSVLSATGLGGLAICANGAVVYDCATQRIATASTIPLPVVEQVVGRLRAELSGMIVALETTVGFVR